MNLTKRTVESLPAPEKGFTAYMDGKTRGFGVRVMPSGSKIFFLDYRMGGRRRALTLGRFGDPLTVDMAREMAEKAKAKVLDGVDPQAAKVASRIKAATVADLIADYREHRLPELRASTVPSHMHFLDMLEKKWGRRDLSSITAVDADALIREFRSEKSERTGKPRSAARVNRLAALISALFNYGQSRTVYKDAIAENPTKGLRKPKEHSRGRTLTAPELARLLPAFADEQEPRFRALWLLLWLTACRRSEILTATWPQVDLEAGTLRLPLTKNGEPRSVSLSSTAQDIIRALPQTESPFLLPSEGRPDRPIAGISKAWARVLAKAEIKNLRIHDIRRSAASDMMAHGASLAEIMAILGHARGAGVGVTLGVYLHATPDSLRPIMEAHAARAKVILGRAVEQAAPLAVRA